eukprot:3643225-Prymnesium_polylepis.1
MSGNAAATAASTTREENPGAGAGEKAEDYSYAQLPALACRAKTQKSDLEVDEPQGRSLARVGASGCSQHP